AGVDEAAAGFVERLPEEKEGDAREQAGQIEDGAEKDRAEREAERDDRAEGEDGKHGGLRAQGIDLPLREVAEAGFERGRSVGGLGTWGSEEPDAGGGDEREGDAGDDAADASGARGRRAARVQHEGEGEGAGDPDRDADHQEDRVAEVVPEEVGFIAEEEALIVLEADEADGGFAERVVAREGPVGEGHRKREGDRPGGEDEEPQQVGEEEEHRDEEAAARGSDGHGAAPLVASADSSWARRGRRGLNALPVARSQSALSCASRTRFAWICALMRSSIRRAASAGPMALLVTCSRMGPTRMPRRPRPTAGESSPGWSYCAIASTNTD